MDLVSQYRRLNKSELFEEGDPIDSEMRNSISEALFFENGRLAQIELKEDTLIGGRLYKGATSVFYYDSGGIYSGVLARNESIFVGGSLYEFVANKTIIYYESGAVLSGTSSKLVSASSLNIKIEPGLVNFWESGAPSTVRAYLGYTVLAGSSEVAVDVSRDIQFFDFDRLGDISIATAYISESIRYLNFETTPNTSHRFYRGKSVKDCGPLMQFTPRYATIEQGYSIPKGEVLRLYESGRLQNLKVSSDIVIQNFPVAQGEEIGLFESGRLKLWIPSRDVNVNGQQFLAFTRVELDVNGDVI